MSEYMLVEVISGVEGDSLYINEMRVCGSKPYGGGTVKNKWKAKRKDIMQAIGVNEEIRCQTAKAVIDKES